MQNFLRLHYADSPPAVTYNSNFFCKKFFCSKSTSGYVRKSYVVRIFWRRKFQFVRIFWWSQKLTEPTQNIRNAQKILTIQKFLAQSILTIKKLLVQSRSNHDCTTSEFRFCLDTPLTILLVLNHGSLFWPLTLIILTIQMCRITNVEFAKGKYRSKNPHFFPCIAFWRPETYPESFYFKPLDPPKKAFFQGLLYHQIFFQFWRYDHDSKYEKH